MVFWGRGDKKSGERRRRVEMGVTLSLQPFAPLQQHKKQTAKATSDRRERTPQPPPQHLPTEESFIAPSSTDNNKWSMAPSPDTASHAEKLAPLEKAQDYKKVVSSAECDDSEPVRVSTVSFADDNALASPLICDVADENDLGSVNRTDIAYRAAKACSALAENLADDDRSTNSDYENIPENLRQHATFLDPFPFATPTSSIASMKSHASTSSPLHTLFEPMDDVMEGHKSPARKFSDMSYLSNSSFQTPVKSPSRNNSSSGWNDPFPTPDVSVHSRCRDPFPTHEELNNEFFMNFSLPPLSCTKSDDGITIKPVAFSPLKRRRSVNDESIMHCHKSSPSLSEMNPPQLRRIASETDLLQPTTAARTSRIPSLEDFWKALRSGPDGNDLTNSPQRKETERRRTQRSKSGELRGSLRGSQSQTNLVLTKTTNSTNKPLRHSRSKDDLDMPKVNATTTPHTQRKIWQGTPILTPVRKLLAEQGRKASNVYRTNSQRIKRNIRERRERRRQRRETRMKEPPRSWWIVIPADHPYKIIWDVMTMVWALLGAYRTHLRIRDRVFDQSPLIILTEVWFTLDILLNFVTEHKTSKGQVIRDGKTVWARYLTTWFVIDLLSLIPWERIYVRPVVEKIKKRNIFQKTFFRSKAVVRVSRVLRGRHIKLLGQVSKQTGTPLRRFVTLLIKYVPKYLLFVRHMKGALFVRGLRFVHWLHNMYKKIWVKAKQAGRSAGNSARQKMKHAREKIYMGRGDIRHPIFQLRELHEDEPLDHDDDTASDDSHEDSHDEDDDELEDLTSFDLSEETGYYSRNSSHGYHRSKSDHSPLRKRTYSGL